MDQSKVPLENETIGVQVKSSAFLNPKKKEEKKKRKEKKSVVHDSETSNHELSNES